MKAISVKFEDLAKWSETLKAIKSRIIVNEKSELEKVIYGMSSYLNRNDEFERKDTNFKAMRRRDGTFRSLKKVE